MKTILNFKLTPHIIELICIFFFFIGLSSLHDSNNEFLAQLIIVTSWLFFGFAGLIIIKTKKYSLGFYEVQGVFAIAHGVLITLAGWVTTVLLCIHFFT